MSKRKIILLSILLHCSSIDVMAHKKDKYHAPTQLTLEEFIPMWFQKSGCKKIATTSCLQYLRKDDDHTYFFLSLFDTIAVYQVQNSDIEKVGLWKIDMSHIRDTFYQHIVPHQEREKQYANSHVSRKIHYSFRYNNIENALDVTLRVKTYVEDYVRVSNKTFRGLYHFETGTITPIE